MKKAKHTIITLIAAMAVTFFAFAGIQQQQQKLKVELTISEWEAVLHVIDQSTASHKDVVAIRAVLLEQLQAQIQTDSTNQNQ